VQVEFRTAGLGKCYAKSSDGVRQWGDKVARKYIDRVNILKHAKSLDDLRKIAALRFHPLKGDQKGRHAMTLVDRWRLIVTFPAGPPMAVRVEEVSAHYGD
jgi:proteic killer suppression protein